MKRFLALLFVVIMVFSFVACGDNVSDNSTTLTTENGMIDTGNEDCKTTATQGTENDAMPTTNSEGEYDVPPTSADSGAQGNSKPSSTTKPYTPTTSTKPVEMPTNDSKEENLITLISPSATSYNLTIGESKTIGYIITPSNSTEKIKWESENKNVVTVDNGTIKAVGIGQTFVKASASKTGFSVLVTVTNKKVAISSFDFKQSQFRLAIGESTIVPTNVTPSNATEKLVWTSSDPKVATVTDGKITAVGKGSAFISASSEKCGSISCSVEVYAPVTNIVFDQSSYTIHRNKSITIGVTLSPSSASKYRLIWTSSNPNVASVTNTGFVCGVSNGTATITVTSEEGGFSKQCTVTVVDAPMTLHCGLRQVSFINGWQEGLEASVAVEGGSGNYSNYKFSIKIYHEDGRMVASGSDILGNSYNSGWISTLNITFREIKGPDYMSNPKEHRGTYTAVFEVIDDKGNSHTGTTTYVVS